MYNSCGGVLLGSDVRIYGTVHSYSYTNQFNDYQLVTRSGPLEHTTTIYHSLRNQCALYIWGSPFNTAHFTSPYHSVIIYLAVIAAYAVYTTLCAHNCITDTIPRAALCVCVRNCWIITRTKQRSSYKLKHTPCGNWSTEQFLPHAHNVMHMFGSEYIMDHVQTIPAQCKAVFLTQLGV